MNSQEQRFSPEESTLINIQFAVEQILLKLLHLNTEKKIGMTKRDLEKEFVSLNKIFNIACDYLEYAGYIQLDDDNQFLITFEGLDYLLTT